MLKALSALAFNYLVEILHKFVPFWVQIGLVVQTFLYQLLVIVYFCVIIWYLGVQRNNLLFPVLVLTSRIKLMLSLVPKSNGYLNSFEIFMYKFSKHQKYFVTISLQFSWPLITNPRSKYIIIDYHFVRELVA